MMEVREILRLWLMGHGYRGIARLVQADHRTVRRYVEAAQRVGLERPGGVEQLTDELLGGLARLLEPGESGRPQGHSW